MAKSEYRLNGNFNSLLNTLHTEILGGSVSATFQDGSDFTAGDVRCAVRVYERHSFIGGTRVGANITLLGVGDELSLSVISAGGSGAIFFKINTWGEEAFTDDIAVIVEKWAKQNDKTRSTQANRTQPDHEQSRSIELEQDQTKREQTAFDQSRRGQTDHDQNRNRFGIFGRKQKRDELDQDIFGRK